VATKAQEENKANSSTERPLAKKDGDITALTEWATSDVNTVDEMVRLFGDQGVAFTEGAELTGDFQLITGDLKQAFCQRIIGKQMFVVRWNFHESSTGEYVTMHVLVDGVGKYILNDGGQTSMYAQLRHITDVRHDQGVTPENGGLLVRQGIKANKAYQYDTRTGKAIKPSDDVPGEFRADARITYRFDL
jgi:hypothetical protein